MPQFELQHPVDHSPAEMFALVADVERYPEFVPLCDSLKVTSRTTTKTGEDLLATMSVGYKGLKESFTTRIALDPSAQTIVVRYLDGPFHHLENRWRFLKPSGAGGTGPSGVTVGSVIDFYISYEFRSALLGFALGPVFDSAFRHFTKAFEDRANEIYGPVKSSQ